VTLFPVDSSCAKRAATVSCLFPGEPVDFDLYLTEQRDKPEEVAVNTQTDAFLPRPPTPPYVPKKTGVDAYTQIEVSDGLFDFDVEVEPILDVIVGKILEQSVVELEQGLELSSLHARKVRECRVSVWVVWMVHLSHPPHSAERLACKETSGTGRHSGTRSRCSRKG
jgi:hypothetical protein